MQIKEIIYKNPNDPHFSVVIMEDNSYFYVPQGYTYENIFTIVEEHNLGLRNIKFNYPRIKKVS